MDGFTRSQATTKDDCSPCRIDRMGDSSRCMLPCEAVFQHLPPWHSVAASGGVRPVARPGGSNIPPGILPSHAAHMPTPCSNMPVAFFCISPS